MKTRRGNVSLGFIISLVFLWSSSVYAAFTPPDCNITAPESVCAGDNLTASVDYVCDPGTYSWTVTNGTLIGGNDTNTTKWTAGDPGTMTISVNITGECEPCFDSVDVTVYAYPVCTIDAPDTVVFGSTGNKASVVATPGASYLWRIWVDGVIDNSLITDGPGTHEITWTAPDSFTKIDIGIIVDAHGCVCIEDPRVGGGKTITGKNPPSIPTLSEWGMIILAILVAGATFVTIRRWRNLQA